MGAHELADRQDIRFLILYALAWAGGSIAYVPFLTILLPAHVITLAQEDSVSWLAYIAFAGAISASAGNIGFGWLSDITRNRRGWIAVGLVLSCALLMAAGPVEHLLPLLGMVVLWQLGLNMMLGPLAAWAGDCVPDHQKGALGGLLAFAPAIGALSGALVTIPGLFAVESRLGIVAMLVAICVLPVLAFGRPRKFPELLQVTELQTGSNPDLPKLHNDVVRMWFARLLVQITEAALFAYLLLWFRSIAPSFSDNDTARIFSFVLMAAVPLAMIAGRWTDLRNRPILPLSVCAAIAAFGLAIMAWVTDIRAAIFGYAIFGIAAGIFLSLHSAQTLRILPRPERRGRDLGVFNLTNTVPSLIMPWLALALVPVFGFSGLFMLLALLAAIASLLLLSLALRK
ncbi:MFS transporter [Sphingorhabdus sp. Alg239-R122]|uniref:MFS transporter n=1 Tax=Sphingorhabdus sp. Alg239-R122 TaxID=2305989 RepID=UPI0013D90791|nr:MFS transporter [Sphingorhabdus sp. Alg239-R122]